MENIKMTVKGNKLTIEVDLSKELGVSKSGKSMIVATTSGNKQIEETGIMMGVNIYKKLNK